MRFVVALEDVLFGDVAEDGDGFVEDLFDFVVGFLGEWLESQLESGDVVLTPLSPRFRWSSMNKDINSGDFSFMLMKVPNA